MRQDIILAGVGGQGILTIAKAISQAALRRGLHVKQAEVHGMSQRGGAVQSHLRLADQEIFSDVIGLGSADIVIAVEPLESLRYVQYLKPDGALVVSVDPFVNITNYPAVESVLGRIAEFSRHVMTHADHLARAAGSGRAANIAMLGAASLFLDLDARELEDVVAEMFDKKGDKVVRTNRRAFHFGRNAGQAYIQGLERGADAVGLRHWLSALPAEELAAPEPPDAPIAEISTRQDQLSGAEALAVERTLVNAYDEGRRQLYEHEVYTIVQLVGAISPPHHVFVSSEEMLSEAQLNQFPGDRVVLKIVSPDIVHKTETNGITFVRKNYNAVCQQIDQLIARHRDTAEVKGVLVVEYVDRVAPGFGNELFVGVRATREFGPVIAAGLGGVDTEYLAHKMRPGLAVAKALATDIDAEQFMQLFKQTAAYEVLSGQLRGHDRIASDGELLRCFRAFIHLARRFCIFRGATGPDVAELEVNPFAFRRQGMVPLDGRGSLQTAVQAPAPRSHSNIERLLQPESIAVIGVSAQQQNFGRIILNNVLAAGYSKDAVRIIKPDTEKIDGVSCVPSIKDLDGPVDLLVVAVTAETLPELFDDMIGSQKARSVILIPGGVGEVKGSENLLEELQHRIRSERQRSDDAPVFIGPNSLGVISRLGNYDTFFIPQDRLRKRRDEAPQPVAIISQSGAFIISVLSKLDHIDPAVAVSLGNQIDVTHADLVRVVAAREDIHTVALYAEGFVDLDGLELLRAFSELRQAGKEVVFYKAGKTQEGRDAAAGHTASVAGDYDICTSGASQAGAMVAESFANWEQLLELTTLLQDKKVRGMRMAALSNAGFETVGIADSLEGPHHHIGLGELSTATKQHLSSILGDYNLGNLVGIRNPMDITPMASGEVYEHCIKGLLAAEEVDAVIAGVVPLTPTLKALAGEITEEDSVVEAFARANEASDKPLVAVVAAGSLFDALAEGLRAVEVPVFRSADQAVRTVAQYLRHRCRVA